MNFDDESDVVSARFMQLLQQLVGQHVQEVQELRRENSRLLDSNARLLTAEKTGTVRHASSTRSTAEAQRLLEASAALEKVLQGLDSRSLTCSSGLPSPAGSPTRGSPTRFEPTEVVMKEREPLHASLTLLPPLEETDSSDKADETYAMGNIKSRSSEDEGHCVLPGSGEARNTSQETHMGVVASISEDPKLLLHRQDGLPYVTSNLSELMSASIFESDGYELVIGGLILVSVMVLGLQLQYQGYLIGHALSYPRMEESPIEVWQNIPVVLRWVDRSFTAIFVVDILLRVIFVGGRFFKRVFNWIDLTVVICCVLEDVFSDEFPFDAPFLRMLRFAKVARALRVLRHAQFLGSLHLLLKSVRASVEVLFWSLCLLLVIQCIAGMLLMQLLQTYLQDSSIDASVRREVFRYYGTFSATLLTMFEVLFANWAPACRILVDNVAEVFSIGFIVYRCLVGFAVLNVVSAVFLQQTMKVAAADQDVALQQRQTATEAYTKKLETFFKKLDKSGDGYLTWAEFSAVLSSPKLQHWLGTLELETDDLVNLFNMMDDGDGEISLEDFLHGARHLRGSARSIDVAEVLATSRRTEAKIEAVLTLIGQITGLAKKDVKRQARRQRHAHD